jgi:hypothetical protein
MLRTQDNCRSLSIRSLAFPESECVRFLFVRSERKSFFRLAPVNVQSPSRIEACTAGFPRQVFQPQQNHISRTKMVEYRLRHPAAIPRIEWRIYCLPKLSCTQIGLSQECMRLQFLHLRRVCPNDYRAEFANSIPVMFFVGVVEFVMRFAKGRQTIRSAFCAPGIVGRRRVTRRSAEKNHKRINRRGHAVGPWFRIRRNCCSNSDRPLSDNVWIAGSCKSFFRVVAPQIHLMRVAETRALQSLRWPSP